MKKILIISYYYPPNSSIASWRPHSWARHFSDPQLGNAEVHVVCRYWTGQEKSWQEQIDPSPGEHNKIQKFSNNHHVHYLVTHPGIKRTLRWIDRVKILQKPYHLLVNLLGHFHIEVDTYFSFRKYIKRNFKKDYFDTVIVTSPPLNLIRLGAHLKKHFPNAFFVADFRDLWSNEKLNEKYKPTRRDRFYDQLNEKYLRKWLKKYQLSTSVSKGLTDEIEKVVDISTEVITNGYEDHIFENLKKNGKDTFNVTSIGTIYAHQEFKTLSEGIISFVRKNQFDPRIRVEFIGAKPYNPAMTDLLESSIPGEILTVTGRVDRNEALRSMKNADVLVYPGWPGYKGRYSGKIFEYLASGNNILIAPSDKDVIEELLKETRTGVCKDDPVEVCSQLQDWYEEWKANGKLKYEGLSEKIYQYSRENQAEKLSEAVLKYKAKT